MANLGTLDFDVRLNDQTAQQAKDIKENLLKNLKIGLDMGSLDSVIKDLKTRLSNEIFEIKLSTDVNSTLSNVRTSLAEIKSNEGVKLVDNESAEKSLSIVGDLRRQVLDLSWKILDQKDVVKEVAYEAARLGDAWRQARSSYGNKSSVTQEALAEYNAAKQALREESVTLFALQQNRSRNNLSIQEQNLAYKQANDALKAARAELNKEKTARLQANKELEKSKKLTLEAKTATESVKASREGVKRQLEEERKKTDELTLAKQKLKNARLEESKAASKTIQSHVRLNGEILKGVRVSADLKEAFTSLYSVHMLREFLSNVIEIGGQLEKQRVSMGAILGDTAKANTLFEQIKGLAIKSPFGVVELDQYTKQLAAYGFEYNELYDMIKRLADISAGAGQDISRLTLALGHVRSEGALSGYTLRQFAMNNIPMLKMLSEYYTELEHQYVSTANIRERISKKEIGYDVVVEQIKRLTNESGMFYNMQEKISDTVAAKWKNLRDAFSIMYGELAESGIGNILKKTAEGLTSMTKDWRQMLGMVAGAAMVFGTARIQSLLLSAALMQQQKSMTANAIATSKYSVAQLRAMAGMSKWTIRLKNFGSIVTMIGNTLSKILFSPALWWMVGIEAAISGFMHFYNKAKDSESAVKSLYETSEEGFRNLHEFTEDLANVDLGKMSDSDFAAGIKELMQQLKDYSPIAGEIMKEANACKTLKERYEYLRGEVMKLEGAYKNLAEIGPIIEAANDSTDGWFDDSFIENVQDYSDAINDVDANLSKLLQHQIEVNQALKVAASNDSGFASATFGKSVKEQVEMLRDFPTAMKAFEHELSEVSMSTYSTYIDYFESVDNLMKGSKKVMMEDLNDFATMMNSDISNRWGDDWKNDAMRVQAAILGVKERFAQANIPMQVTKKILEEIFNNRWHLNIDFGPMEDLVTAEDEEDPNKDKTDEFLKSIKKRIKAIQDARKEYEALLKLGETSENALNRIAFMGVSNDDIVNYKDAIKKLAAQLGNGTSERDDYQKEIGKYFLGIDKEVLQAQVNEDKEQLKKAVTEITEYVKKETSKFSLFKTLLEKTGDENFAAKAFTGGQMWDGLTNSLRQKLEETIGKSISNWSMDDELAEKIFGKDTPALKLYQEIVAQLGENYRDSLGEAADAMNKVMTTEQKIERLTQQINEWEHDTSDINREAQIEQAKNEIEDLKASLFSTLPVYEQIFGDTAYRSIGSIREGVRQLNELIDNQRENPADSNGKTIMSSYTDENGVEHQVTLTLSEFRRLKEQSTKMFDAIKDKNPFAAVSDAFKSLKEVLNDDDASTEDKEEEWKKLSSTIADCADIVGDLAGKFGDMFDKLGNEGMANAMDDVQAGMNSISNIGKGFAEGGIFGGAIAAAGEVANWVGRIADKHDKKLDKAIEESARKVKGLQNAYKNLEWEVARQLTGITEKQTAEMLRSLQQQQKELEKQREAESQKKKKDASKLMDYDQQIEEMKQQLADFYMEMANEMYGIDLDSWASQISDALTDAFAKGEDAMEAFNNAVADIMDSVVKNIIKIGVVKPAMEELQNYLFGSNGIATLKSDKGVQITADEAQGLVKQLDKLRGQIDTGKTIYDAIADAMRAIGIDPSAEGSSSSGGLSKGIQGMTEETSNLLASYINAVRADVSVIRQMMQEQLAIESNPVSQAQLMQLQMITDYTGQTARNTESINMIYDILTKNVNGVMNFHIQ